MADAIEEKIILKLEAQPAIQEAKVVGDKLNKALSIKGNSDVTQMVSQLRQGAEASNAVYENIKKTVLAVKDNAKFQKNVTEQLEIQNKLKSEQSHLANLQKEIAAEKENLRLQQEKYKLDPEKGAAYTKATHKRVLGLAIGIQETSSHIEELTARSNTLEGVINSMISRAIANVNGEVAQWVNGYKELDTLASNILSKQEAMGTKSASPEIEDSVEQAENLTEALNDANKAAEGIKEVHPEVDTSNVDEATEEITSDVDKIKEESKVTLDLNADVAKMNVLELIRYLEALKKREKELRADPGADPQEYEQVREAIKRTQQQLEGAKVSFKSYASGAAQAINIAKRAIDALRSAIHGINNAINRVLKAVVSLARKITSAFKSIAHTISAGVGKALDKLRGKMDKTFSSGNLKQSLKLLIKYAFGVRSIFFFYRKLRAGVKEGIKNLVQYDSANNKTNQSITQLRSSLLYLKNAWGAAFAPIINAVTPILVSFLDLLARVGNAVARFIAALTGQSRVYQAVKIDAGDYAKSLDKTASGAGKAAKNQKKLNDRLADFDDLNVLGRDRDTGSGSGGGGGSGLADDALDFNKMFEEIETPKFPIIDKIKEAWEKSDFTELGKTLGKKLGEALDTAYEWLKSDGKKLIEKIANSIGTFLDGLLDPDNKLGEKIGRTLAQAVVTGLGFINTLITPTRMSRLGTELATAINKAAPVIIPEIGKTIGNLIVSAISGFYSFATTFDYKGFGKSISKAINNFLNKMSVVDATGKNGWQKLGATLNSAITGLLDMLIVIIDEVNWDEVGKAIGDMLAEIDVSKIGEQLKTLAGKLWDGLKKAWNGLKESNPDLAQGIVDIVGVVTKVLLAVAAIKLVLGGLGLLLTTLSGILSLAGLVVKALTLVKGAALLSGAGGVASAAGGAASAAGGAASAAGTAGGVGLFGKIISGAKVAGSVLVKFAGPLAIATAGVATFYATMKRYPEGFLDEQLSKDAVAVDEFLGGPIMRLQTGYSTLEDAMNAFRSEEKEKSFHDEMGAAMQIMDDWNKKVDDATKKVDEYREAVKRDQEQIAEGKYVSSETFNKSQLTRAEADLENLKKAQKDWEDQMEAIRVRYQAYLQGIDMSTEEALAIVKGKTDDTLTGIDESVTTTTDGISETVSTAANDVTTTVDTMGTEIEESTALSGDAITSNVQKTSDEVNRVFDGIGADGIGTFQNLSDDTIKIFEDMGAKVSKSADGITIDLSDSFTGMNIDVKDVFGDTSTDVSGIMKEMDTNVTTTYSNTTQRIEELSTEAQQHIGASWETMRADVSATASSMTAGLTTTFESFRTSTIDTFKKVRDGVKPVLNNILSYFNGMIGGITSALNSLIKQLNNFKVDFPEGLENVGGKRVSFNLATMSATKIPYLAKGAVIPPNKEFMAVLGDQKNGTNIEAPLDTIKQAVAEELAAQINAMMEGFGMVVQAINNKDLSIGDKDIGRANARYVNQQNLIRGTSI